MPSLYVLALVNERHLVDFLQRGYPRANLAQSALPQRNHALTNRRALDLRRRTPVDNHFADVVRQIQELADYRAPVESGSRTFQASAALREYKVLPLRRIQSRFDKFLVAVLLR